jgi:hypothetical protein
MNSNCEFWGSHGGEGEDVVLGCDAVEMEELCSKQWYLRNSLHCSRAQNYVVIQIFSINVTRCLSHFAAHCNYLSYDCLRGLILDGGRALFVATSVSDPALGSPFLLLIGYRGLFPWGQRGQSVKLTSHLHLVSMLRMPQVWWQYSNYVSSRRDAWTL